MQWSAHSDMMPTSPAAIRIMNRCFKRRALSSAFQTLVQSLTLKMFSFNIIWQKMVSISWFPLSYMWSLSIKCQIAFAMRVQGARGWSVNCYNNGFFQHFNSEYSNIHRSNLCSGLTGYISTPVRMSAAPLQQPGKSHNLTQLSAVNCGGLQ